MPTTLRISLSPQLQCWAHNGPQEMRRADSLPSPRVALWPKGSCHSVLVLSHTHVLISCLIPAPVILPEVTDRALGSGERCQRWDGADIGCQLAADSGPPSWEMMGSDENRPVLSLSGPSAWRLLLWSCRCCLPTCGSRVARSSHLSKDARHHFYAQCV